MRKFSSRPDKPPHSLETVVGHDHLADPKRVLALTAPRTELLQKVRYSQMHRYACQVDAKAPTPRVYRELWPLRDREPQFSRNAEKHVGGGPRTTEPCGLLASLGPGTNEPGAAHPASFGDRLEPHARPPASGLRERGPGRPPRTSRDRNHRRRRPAAAGQDAGPERRPASDWAR